MFAFEHELSPENKPDIITLEKSLSGGFMPVSCVLTSNEVMDCI